jgi:hypothetical protein
MEPTQTLMQEAPEALSSEVRRTGHEADHSTPSL